MGRPSVVLQEQLALMRIGFESLFSGPDSEVELLETLASRQRLPRRCAELQPDVIVFGLHGGTIESTDRLARSCRAAAPHARLVALHLGRRSDHAEIAEQLGVDLLSYAAPLAIATATISGHVDLTAVESDRRRQRPAPPTARARAILNLVAQGLPCSQIALEIGGSRRDVERELEQLQAALGVDSVAAAVSRGRAIGLLPQLLSA
jgi:DNA-binding NarL/FixJ family response regulator